MLLGQIAHSAVGGFGSSIGRDLYRGAKKNPAIFVVIGAMLLAFGWRNALLGRNRSLTYNIFVTFIGSILMIVTGAIMVGLGGYYLAVMFAGSGQPNLLIPAALLVLVSLIGIMWGRRDAASRQLRAEVEAKNLQFLEEIGLQDSGFESDMLQDADGNLLKIRKQSDDRIVFSVANRRGLRAAIALRDGEMVSYTGIVKV